MKIHCKNRIELMRFPHEISLAYPNKTDFEAPFCQGKKECWQQPLKSKKRAIDIAVQVLQDVGKQV